MSDVTPLKIMDAYAHVALPRFMGADELLRVMDDNGVDRAHICTAETCPDLTELSRAAVDHSDRFIVSGLPLGDNPDNVLASIRAQLESGMIGLRISDSVIAGHPAILDLLGEFHATPFVVGSPGLTAAAALLADFLDRYRECIVCAPHFAGGPGSPEILNSNHAVARLFSHPRFFVIFSRHGAFDQAALVPWAKSIIARVSWKRIMFGSEYPVALFRDETYASTFAWLDSSGIEITNEDRQDFLYANAHGHLFSRPAARPPRQLDKTWCRMDLRHEAPVWLFPRGTLDIPEHAHRKLLAAYLARGGERSGSFRSFVAEMLARAADSAE